MMDWKEKLYKAWILSSIVVIGYTTYMAVAISLIAGIGIVLDPYLYLWDRYTELFIVVIVVCGVCCISASVTYEVLKRHMSIYKWSDKLKRLNEKE